MTYLTERELNTIRGKAMVGHATPSEIISVFRHYDEIEFNLNVLAYENTFGTEGWRHAFGLPE